jgi:hypothetical protein
MSGLIHLALTVLPVSTADLLLFFRWYHLSNAQTKFLLYGEWLAYANDRFVTSGFVAGSLVLLGALGVSLVSLMLHRWPQTATWWQAAALNALIVPPGVLMITQTADFDPPLWTALAALVFLLVLNTTLFAAWQHFPPIGSTVAISLLVMAGYTLSTMVLYVPFHALFDIRRWGPIYSTVFLLGAALPVFLILAVGALWVWRWMHRAWQRSSAMVLYLDIVLLRVPCFAAAHYVLASDVHYITSSGNLVATAILGLACGPALAGLLALADVVVTRRLLPKRQAALVEWQTR